MNKWNWLILFSLMLLLSAPMHALASESKETEAKTSAPPEEAHVDSTFDPYFNYLENGYGYITAQGSGKVSISGESHATQYVDTLGVQMTLQRYTGSDWVDVNVGSDYTNSESKRVYASDTRQVASGYYYRLVTKHWAVEGSVTESGYRTSSSVLVN
ncbi:hypothetical protein ACFQI7_24025 [Paenibacillus allorhizosphaerae]|uniref:Uncharacterized protein n=1 Tax=Paenibacillus allorhizosphaerae TaxID=2849866 RepID=A0ABM8VK86_9BACL|nr:hypothetical protein [Paenibacillus allorhizosphaerae]CAG7646676.1 hypothetical protein PAECIP111802_03804 [Paenibacillus allorhizosphaerae]